MLDTPGITAGHGLLRHRDVVFTFFIVLLRMVLNRNFLLEFLAGWVGHFAERYERVQVVGHACHGSAERNANVTQAARVTQHCHMILR